MKVSRPTTDSPEELLAAYADDGLDDDERRNVESFLSQNPEHAEELDALREVVAQVRELAPRPQAEPNWDRLAADISRACDEAAAQDAVTWWAKLSRWLQDSFRPRYAVAMAGAAVAILALFLFARGYDDDKTPSAPDNVAPVLEVADNDPALELELIEDELDLEGLDEIELAEVIAGLEDELAADLDLEASLSFEDASEWVELDNSIASPGDDLELELFGEPDYDSWLGELSEEDLDALDAYLVAEQAG